jgi:hypothetical protein
VMMMDAADQFHIGPHSTTGREILQCIDIPASLG